MAEIRFETVVRVAADRERLFAAMTDLAGFGAWMQGFVRAEKLTEGPYGVGTAFRETRKLFGREASEHFEVVTCEAPSRLVLRVDGAKGATGKGEFLFAYDLVTEGSETVLRSRAEIRMPGFFAAIMLPLFKRMMKKMCDRDLAALKAHVEGRAAGPAA